MLLRLWRVSITTGIIPSCAASIISADVLPHRKPLLELYFPEVVVASTFWVTERLGKPLRECQSYQRSAVLPARCAIVVRGVEAYATVRRWNRRPEIVRTVGASESSAVSSGSACSHSSTSGQVLLKWIDPGSPPVLGRLPFSALGAGGPLSATRWSDHRETRRGLRWLALVAGRCRRLGCQLLLRIADRLEQPHRVQCSELLAQLLFDRFLHQW